MTQYKENTYAAPSLGRKLLNRRQIRRLIPSSEMTLWRWERDGLFPRHITINSRNYWLASEIEEWIERKSKERNQDNNSSLNMGHCIIEENLVLGGHSDDER